MADYLRQLRNDEKRCTFSMVATLNYDDTPDLNPVKLFVVPEGSVVTRIYAFPKEPFAAGSTVTVGIYDGSSVGEVYFTDLPLDTTALVTISPVSDTQSFYSTGNSVDAVFNQAGVDSLIGKVQIVVEFTEEPVRIGSYTK